MNLKSEIINGMTDENKEAMIKDGYLRYPKYEFGTEVVKNKEKKLTYECEYLDETRSLSNSRLLWMASVSENVDGGTSFGFMPLKEVLTEE